MKNSKGFIYPAAVFAAVICMLCASHSAALLTNQRTFAQQTKEFHIQQNLLQNGILHALSHIHEETKEKVQKQHGLISYSVSPAHQQLTRVQIQVTTASGTETSAQFQYDLRNQKITQWKEY
ncbi:competence type IV pilus minor pilin ComGG [Bacillus licheniformis]|uniref:Probably part of the DNA transport machinery ComGG n=3 Tax=Bacillus licheniformis TaxID=1402 RepID=Q65HE8_BACLD|nr:MULTISPECIES: competence type IV pilus minor pilin ComGG [Bacillus]MBJ7883801.1 chromosome partitioning protein ParA [Bacillaceae bacterium HSR45]MBY8347185.1 chromosome partitioning protein ParA [Bacillus sp. PCH94]MDP4080337.1 competence type IV pilus minor pilin ComGG [Bacillota bacterium]NBB44300.1 chromosome partitioning protein ParA [Bacillus sp. y1(2019)]AAU24156.1 probably part of the DNA transport machinery ComGG [Bacillus licheniformis DSM 13 = ATCC 14580]